MEKIYIDAGGTKIAGYCVVKNEVTIKKIDEPGNINSNYENAKVNIINLLNLFDSTSAKEVYIGAAGASGNKVLADKLKNELEILFVLHIFHVVGDLDLLCDLLNDNDYLLVNCGTGTIAIHNDGEKLNTYLGWGKLVNDLASGYDIGINFIKFLSFCEDQDQDNSIYKKFLIEHNFDSIRNLIPIITNNSKEISNISKWVSQQNKRTVEYFILNRVKKLFRYLSFIEFNNLYLTGSIFEKNSDVQELINISFPDKKITIINFEIAIKNKFSIQ